jgi:hypothetical protein
MVLLKLTVQIARIKKAEFLENIDAVDVKIALPIHGIPSAVNPDHPPCTIWSLSSLLLSFGAIFTPASSRNFFANQHLSALTFNQARRGLSPVLHVHIIHVHVVHLHAIIHRFGLGNFA